MIPGKGIENKEEYNLSKTILIDVVNCEVLSKCFGPDTIKAISQFLNEKMFVHVSSYLAYEKKKLFNMEQHSNSAHEDTNNDIKSSGHGRHCQDTLVGATAKCGNYDRTHLGWSEKEVSRLYVGRTKFLDGFGFVTKYIVSVLQNQMNQSKHSLVDVDVGESDIVCYVMNSTTKQLQFQSS